MEYQRAFLSNQTNIVPQPRWKPRPPTAAAVPVTSQIIEYSSEISEYFLDEERALYSSRMYMDQQPEITDRMRKILVDWLADVITEYKLHPETYFLAIDIIDRYLCSHRIPRSQLQLVGITSILIAAKHEEVWPPTVNDCVVVTANTYHARDVIDMEREIATSLRFKFTVPTIYPLACRFIEIAAPPAVVKDAIFLLLESAVHCYPLLRYLPSRIAATAFVLGSILFFFNSNQYSGSSISISQFWTNELVSATRGLTADEIKPILDELLIFSQKMCSSASKLQAIRRKYLSPKFHSVSALDFPSGGIIVK
ncbi:cyclin A [Angomonas deanei]|nr:cyclin A [Angomonas deanei]|eukprot:EPY40044.1 cyclin A [Angomonas deanei]